MTQQKAQKGNQQKIRAEEKGKRSFVQEPSWRHMRLDQVTFADPHQRVMSALTPNWIRVSHSFQHVCPFSIAHDLRLYNQSPKIDKLLFWVSVPVLLILVLIPVGLRMLLFAERQYLILDITFTAITNLPSKESFSNTISEKHAAVFQTALIESLVGCHPSEHAVFVWGPLAIGDGAFMLIFDWGQLMKQYDNLWLTAAQVLCYATPELQAGPEGLKFASSMTSVICDTRFANRRIQFGATSHPDRVGTNAHLWGLNNCLCNWEYWAVRVLLVWVH